MLNTKVDGCRRSEDQRRYGWNMWGMMYIIRMYMFVKDVNTEMTANSAKEENICGDPT